MLKLRRITNVYEMKVFTDTGDYFGDVEETILSRNKISGWKIRASKNSYLSKVLGNAKGVIVPHPLVKAIGDIVIISRQAMPSFNPDDEEGQTE